MSRAARSAEEAEAASKAAEDMTLVTYNYSFFHFIFALASMYLAMLMTGMVLPDCRLCQLHCKPALECVICRGWSVSALLHGPTTAFLDLHGAIVISMECTAAFVWWYDRPLTVERISACMPLPARGTCCRRPPKLALAGIGLSMVVSQASVCCQESSDVRG